MPTLPIVFTTREDPLFIQELEDRIKATHNSDFLLNYPIVYIHYWVSGTVSYTDKRGNPHSYNKYGVYVGESNDVINPCSSDFPYIHRNAGCIRNRTEIRRT